MRSVRDFPAEHHDQACWAKLGHALPLKLVRPDLVESDFVLAGGSSFRTEILSGL